MANNLGVSAYTVGGDFNTWGDKYLADMAILNKFAGDTKVVSDVAGTVVLTAVDMQNFSIKADGGGAGQVDIRVVDGLARFWLVKNKRPTGAITIRCAAGGAAITLNAGDNRLVQSDGVDCFDMSVSTLSIASTTGLQAALDGLLASNFLGGLTLSNNVADAVNDIDIAAGAAMDTTSVKLMRLAAGITKRLDAAWAVGTNQGGLDTGAIANVTYHMFLIMRPDTGVVDVLFSASATAPTMPANYTLKRRIGSIIRKTNAILGFRQLGDFFDLNPPPTASDVGFINGPTTAQTVTLTVPAGIVVLARVVAAIDYPAGVTFKSFLYLSPLIQGDLAPSTTRNQLAAGSNGDSVVGVVEVLTNALAQIRSRISATGGLSTLDLTATGWIDYRGK